MKFSPSLKARAEASFGRIDKLLEEVQNHISHELTSVQDKHDELLALLKEFLALYENREQKGNDAYQIELFKFYLKLKGVLK